MADKSFGVKQLNILGVGGTISTLVRSDGVEITGGGLGGNLRVTGISTFNNLEVGSNIQLGNAGVVTATSLDISGDVSIGGTLTYEDVTNICLLYTSPSPRD